MSSSTPPRLLILSQYYPPETGAPQNRLHDLACRLQALGVEITVLTAAPNYPQMQIYQGYRNTFQQEQIDQIEVFRCWIYIPQSRRFLPRLLNYFSFVFSSLVRGFLLRRSWDYILCESPPLFLGLSAWVLARLKRAHLILNVSDLWPESAEKLGLVKNVWLLKAATRLEHFLYRQAALITGQTQGILRTIQKTVPDKPLYWLKNGVAPIWFETPDGRWREQMGFAADEFVVLYAGILGHAQGLDVILDAARILPSSSRVRFVLVGDGPRRQELAAAIIAVQQRHRVTLLPLVPQSQMRTVVAACDAAVVPLRRLALFEGAIPSKIFESLASGKPVLLGVAGEAHALFVEQGKCALFFQPEDGADLARQVQRLSQDPELYQALSQQAVHFVREHFNRETIGLEFWRWLQSQQEVL